MVDKIVRILQLCYNFHNFSLSIFPVLLYTNCNEFSAMITAVRGEDTMHLNRFRARQLICWLSVFCWMGLIFWFSSQDATASAASSDSALAFLLRMIFPDKADAIFSDSSILLWVTFLLRKSAHFFIFTVLGLLLYITIVQYPDSAWIQRIVIPVSVGIVYACIDELHQFFVPGRACQIRDVLIDTAGVCCGVIVCLCVHMLLQKKRKKQAA